MNRPVRGYPDIGEVIIVELIQISEPGIECPKFYRWQVVGRPDEQGKIYPTLDEAFNDAQNNFPNIKGWEHKSRTSFGRDDYWMAIYEGRE